MATDMHATGSKRKTNDNDTCSSELKYHIRPTHTHSQTKGQDLCSSLAQRVNCEKENVMRRSPSQVHQDVRV